MASARRLYRIQLAVALLASSAVGVAAAAAVTRLRFGLPSGEAIAAACRQVVPLQSGLAMFLIVGLIAMSGAVVALATQSALRQMRDQRRVLRSLGELRPTELAGRWILVFNDLRPHAFCAGLLWPRIYLSTAAIALLSPAELRAVIAHETHHRARHDPLRILAARVLADALFFLPGLRRLGERYRQLAELAADEAATRTEGSQALAAALLTFGREDGEPAANVVGVAPERVDHLLGQPPRWQLPVSVFAISAVSLAVLLGVVVTLPSLAGQGSVSLAALLAEGCMLAMFGLPVAAGTLGFSLSRRWLRRLSP